MMDDVMFNEYYKKYYKKDRTIQGIARKLAKSDYELYQDLVQIGLETLWKLDPEKAKTNKDAWIRQAMRFRMIDHLRKLKLRNVESLDRRLENGEQIELDSVTGDIRLISPPRKGSSSDLGTKLRESVEPSSYEILSEEGRNGY